MSIDVNSLFPHYKSKGVLIDTNILLLYFVGATNRERISRFKRTEQFAPDDYDLLLQIIDYFQNLVTTPNILTEVSNLVNQLGEPERSRCFSIFAQVVSIFNEFYIESNSVITSNQFVRFGLTDCGIESLVRGKYLVLTDDLKLAVHLQREGIDTVNFNNLRTYGWR